VIRTQVHELGTQNQGVERRRQAEANLAATGDAQYPDLDVFSNQEGFGRQAR
jgi:hypothetical protein